MAMKFRGRLQLRVRRAYFATICRSCFKVNVYIEILFFSVPDENYTTVHIINDNLRYVNPKSRLLHTLSFKEILI